MVVVVVINDGQEAKNMTETVIAEWEARAYTYRTYSWA